MSSSDIRGRVKSYVIGIVLVVVVLMLSQDSCHEKKEIGFKSSEGSEDITGR